MSENTGVKEEGGSPDTSNAENHMIPRSRLNEEIGKKKELEEKALQLEKQVADLTNVNQKWGNWYSTHKDVIEGASQKETPKNGQTNEKNEDLTEKYIRDSLGRDEEGDKAWDTLSQHFEHKFSKTGAVTIDQVKEIVQDAVGGVMGQLNSTFQTKNRFEELVNSGFISQDQSAELQGKLGGILQENPELARQPTNLKYVIDSLLLDGVVGKKIEPYKVEKTRNENPLSGGGPGMSVKEMEVNLDTSNSPFQSLRGVKADKIKALDAESSRRYPANG